MAKLTGVLRLKGKLKSAGLTFVEGPNGTFVRSLPKVKTEKSEEYKQRSKNTGDVSRLAGQMDRVFKEYARGQKEIRMYKKLLSRLQLMKTTNRFILLHGLKGLDAHSLKSMERLGMHPQVKVNIEGRKLLASLDYSHHPAFERDHNFYRLELIVVQWNAGKDEPTGTEQHTKWIARKDEISGYDLAFDLSENCMDWIVLLRCRLAEEKGTKRLPPDNIVQITDAGSFDEASIAALQDWLAAKAAASDREVKDFSEEDDGVEGRERRT